MTLRTALLLASLAAVTGMPAGLLAGDDPLDALNRVIQDRFAGIDKFFGLRRMARNAFVELQRRDRYPFALAGAKFSARAVRANAGECLTCHKGHKQGDPLGVVMYAYR